MVTSVEKTVDVDDNGSVATTEEGIEAGSRRTTKERAGSDPALRRKEEKTEKRKKSRKKMMKKKKEEEGRVADLDHARSDSEDDNEKWTRTRQEDGDENTDDGKDGRKKRTRRRKMFHCQTWNLIQMQTLFLTTN